jgi:hypothetical protein
MSANDRTENEKAMDEGIRLRSTLRIEGVPTVRSMVA